MKMRHNILVHNDKGEFVFHSQTQVGRYSQWFDHSDIHFFEVFRKPEFEFKPHQIHFLVPLFKKELYLVRSENKEGTLSEQFIFCSDLKNLQILSFPKMGVWVYFKYWISVCYALVYFDSKNNDDRANNMDRSFV
jgi:hypothetical protein